MEESSDKQDCKCERQCIKYHDRTRRRERKTEAIQRILIYDKDEKLEVQDLQVEEEGNIEEDEKDHQF